MEDDILMQICKQMEDVQHDLEMLEINEGISDRDMDYERMEKERKREMEMEMEKGKGKGKGVRHEITLDLTGVVGNTGVELDSQDQLQILEAQLELLQSLETSLTDSDSNVPIPTIDPTLLDDKPEKERKRRERVSKTLSRQGAQTKIIKPLIRTKTNEQTELAAKSQTLSEKSNGRVLTSQSRSTTLPAQPKESKLSVSQTVTLPGSAHNSNRHVPVGKARGPRISSGHRNTLTVPPSIQQQWTKPVVQKRTLDQVPPFIGVNSLVDPDFPSTTSEDELVEKSDSKTSSGRSSRKVYKGNNTIEFSDIEGWIPVINDSCNKFVLEGYSKSMGQIKMIDKRDIYEQDFFSNVHLNFIGAVPNKEEEYKVISVLKQPTIDGKYIGLETNKKGTKNLIIDKSSLEYDGKNSFSDKVEQYLKKEFPTIDWYPVENVTFPHSLRLIEKKHPQKQNTLKIAFLYSKGNEKELKDFFAYREDNIQCERYFNFLNLLGERIQLLGWKRYRGDIGVETDQSSYYTEWNGIEVMFHVCLWMDSEQHRRLIGNDVVFVIFHDTQKGGTEGIPVMESFDPGPLDALGTVPQVFGVVQEYGDSYRFGFFSRPTIKPYDPRVPENYLFSPAELKDFLFTKVYNGYCQALSCPPMNRLFEVPRASCIAELVSKFPKSTAKDIARVEKDAQRKREGLIAKIKDPLLLLVTVHSLESTKPLNGLVVSVTILDSENKTQPIKDDAPKTEIAINEILVFNVVAVDPALHHITINLGKDKGIKSKKGFTCAPREISFREICQNLSNVVSYNLDIPGTSESVTIKLSYLLKGPASQPCRLCNLFLGGSADLVLYRDQKFHYSCITCSRCSIPTPEEFRIQGSDIFCRKCYNKNFSTDFEFEEEENEGKIIKIEDTPIDDSRKCGRRKSIRNVLGTMLTAKKGIGEKTTYHSNSSLPPKRDILEGDVEIKKISPRRDAEDQTPTKLEVKLLPNEMAIQNSPQTPPQNATPTKQLVRSKSSTHWNDRRVKHNLN
eukprot:TRINITY_DN18383_c0_g1_i1.p1 TRINITY_DN18383_c0_g1~~TRINITY_DN18383_c0_g1_i1.p1  ORF type:complete len:1012 (+),score=193.77 TRINITY_DN18383_c0_g1_i1:180-3215(+)